MKLPHVLTDEYSDILSIISNLNILLEEGIAPREECYADTGSIGNFIECHLDQKLGDRGRLVLKQTIENLENLGLIQKLDYAGRKQWFITDRGQNALTMKLETADALTPYLS